MESRYTIILFSFAIHSITSISGSLSNVCGYVLALAVRFLGIGYLVIDGGIHKAPVHFFCDCNKYNNSREKLYLELGNQHLFLENDSKEKLINILTSKKYVVIKPVDICMDAIFGKFIIDFTRDLPAT